MTDAEAREHSRNIVERIAQARAARDRETPGSYRYWIEVGRMEGLLAGWRHCMAKSRRIGSLESWAKDKTA